MHLCFRTLLFLALCFHLSSSQSHALFLPLSHTISTATTSSNNGSGSHLLHLLKTTTLRSSARFRSHRRHHSRRHQVSLPLSPGSDYTLSLSLGPSTTVDLYMDTGSDLVWFPCAPFECILCDGKPTPSSPPPPPPPPPNSSLLSCSHPSCSAAHSSLPSSDLCAIAGCSLDDLETDSCPPAATCPSLYYAYGDGSLVAKLRHGQLFFPTDSHLTLKNFTFGCAHAALAEPIGVAGFGRGQLSLPAQLSTTRFSYCLVSHSFQSQRLSHPSPLILGRSAGESLDSLEPVMYTPMLHNPKHPYFYLVSLEAMSVGTVTIPAEANMKVVDGDGNGGVVVDSGTTYTMLPGSMHAKVMKKFDGEMTAAGYKRAGEVESETGLSPCYYYSSKNESRGRVPSMKLHFAGGATVALPRRNYFLGFQRGGRGVGCLMMMSSDAGGGDGDDEKDSGGPAATLGNFQQQGMEVVYDLEGRRVGFAHRRCAALWDSLARNG